MKNQKTRRVANAKGGRASKKTEFDPYSASSFESTPEGFNRFFDALKAASDAASDDRKRRPWATHDLCFKYFLTKKAFAIEFIKRLAPSLANDLDLDELTVVDSNHFDAALNYCASDVVYRVPIKGAKSGECKNVVLVLEHKAQNGKQDRRRLLFQLMKYLVFSTERIVEDNPGVRRPLQAVVVVVNTSNDENYKPPRWDGAGLLQGLVT